MRILVADDDRLIRRQLSAAIRHSEQHEVVEAQNGEEAWESLVAADAPRLAIVDWVMPGIDGPELIRRFRALGRTEYVYFLLLTARGRSQDVVDGLTAGADDYLVKPVAAEELRCRVATGVRILTLESRLAEKVEELQGALQHVRRLQGLLPICMFCKKIRDEEAVWHGIEEYIAQHADVLFTHTLCQECRDRHYPELSGK